MKEKKLDDHYTNMGIEPIVYTTSNNMDPYQHTIIKYVSRYEAKGGLRDLRAAALLLDKYIETLLNVDEVACLNNVIGAIRARGIKYDCLCSKGRGGLWAMAQIGYALNIPVANINPVVRHKDDRCLYVDDIADTGKTLEGVQYDTVVMVKRHNCLINPTYVGKVITHDEYVNFPISQQFDKESK